MAKSKASTKAKTSAPRRNSRPNRRKPMSPEPTTKGSAANPAPTASAGSPEHGGKRPLCRPRRHGRDFCRFRNRFNLRRTDLASIAAKGRLIGISNN